MGNFKEEQLLFYLHENYFPDSSQLKARDSLTKTKSTDTAKESIKAPYYPSSHW
jgi:hypothetical protein